MTVFEFQKKYRTKEEREKALKKMTNDEINEIIKTCGTMQGKIYYGKFRKKG